MKSENTTVKLYFVFLTLRVVYGLFQTTFFIPDEIWQGPEIAHLLVFGRGHATWEWSVGLRSYVHPLIFGAVFKILDILHLDTYLAVMVSPRLVQATIAAAGDVAVYRISVHLGTAPYASVFHLTNWFSVFAYSRALVNSAEVSFVLLGTMCFIEERFLTLALVAGLSFAIRPSSALFFIPLCVAVAMRTKASMTAQCLLCGSVVIGAATFVDSVAHGAFLFPSWNFVKYNLTMGIGATFGVSVWHYFFTFGLTVYFLGALPSVIRNFRLLPVPVLLGCLLMLASLSASPHKEFRFAVPVFAVLGCVINVRAKFVFIHILVAIFISRIHGRGAEQILPIIRDMSKHNPNLSVLFMRCHSTPWLTSIHDRPDLVMDFLECAPYQVTDKVMSDRASYDRDPPMWIRTHAERVAINDVVVLDADPAVEQELTSMGYVETSRFWDGFSGDANPANDFSPLGDKFLVIMVRHSLPNAEKVTIIPNNTTTTRIYVLV
jgi:phosphatidylinositol glycan class B